MRFAKKNEFHRNSQKFSPAPPGVFASGLFHLWADNNFPRLLLSKWAFALRTHHPYISPWRECWCVSPHITVGCPKLIPLLSSPPPRITSPPLSNLDPFWRLDRRGRTSTFCISIIRTPGYSLGWGGVGSWGDNFGSHFSKNLMTMITQISWWC